MRPEFSHLLEHVKSLPYGRNSNRADYRLVPIEKKGSCSTKHAYIKHIADKNNWTDVKLMIGIYLMSELNTPGVGEILEKYQLSEIPEAHTYLKVEGEIVDITGLKPAKESFLDSLLDEQEIQPEHIGSFKLNYHKTFIKNWSENTHFSAEELWDIREKCIKELSI